MTKAIPMRDRILDATAKLIVEHGTQVSMSKIAQGAEVAAGSLYNHFDSKEDLIHAVYERLAGEFACAIAEGDEAAVPPQERLERYIDNYIAFIWDDPDRAVLFEYLASVPILPPQMFVESFQASAAFINEILNELSESGWLAEGDTFFMAGFLGGAIRNSLKWQRAYDRHLTDEDRLQIKAMCMRAIRQKT
ncbi:TetR/AcrR family transcriptional regulator [Pseudodonghicola xiamenensis]|nr:TetR/AcrR family transcriptional regulator [Pseudodonghicola xiamenensis]